jgi:hypothetical protein
LPEDPLTPVVRQFLRDHIQSIEQLEILQVMQREPQRSWSSDELYDVIRSNGASIASRLAQFAQANLIEENASEPGRFLFKPRTEELGTAVAETLETYRVRSVLVIETIFKPPTDAAQRFADAFRFKSK